MAKFFLRFRWGDPEALAREIGAASAALASARTGGDVTLAIEQACRLAMALTAADREHEAVALLADPLANARKLGDPAHIAWTLHYFATAEQYCGDRDAAQLHFAEALDIATSHDLREVEHFVWHHRGRCFAEQGDVPEARRCFEKALAIREEIDEPRAEKTRQALAALDAL